MNADASIKATSHGARPLDDFQFALLGLTVGVSLLAHVAHLPLWLTLGGATALLLRVFDRMRRHRAWSGALRLPLAAILFALVIAHYGTVLGREPGTELALGILVLKLLETERERDARVLVAFSAFVLMSALLASQKLVFTAAICAALIVNFTALVALQPGIAAAPRRWVAPLRVGALLLGLGMPLAVAAFVLIPRFSGPLWGSPNPVTASTGLSERMAPGSMTDLLIDDSPAFRVTFDGRPPAPARRYFRAIVMWDFDGTAWTRGNQYWPRAPEALQSTGTPIAYDLSLQSDSGPWLPALDMPVAAPDQAFMGADRSLYRRPGARNLQKFRIESTLDYQLAPELNDRDRERALALPVGFDPRSRELAARWRNSLSSDSDVINAALAMYRAEFTYTLTPPLLGRNSVDDFLFDTQAGFCEHYSSSFTFLMRAAGIPARVVTGFQGGTWIADKYLLVRNSDAHAWSEVWLDGRGWVRVDPTAAVSPARVELGAGAVNAGGWVGRSWVRGLRNSLDRLERAWTEGVIKFDVLQQRRVLSPFGIADVEQRSLWLAFAIVLALVLVFATLWALRSERTRRGDALDRAWRAVDTYMRRIDLGRRPSEGPQAWLARVRAHGSATPEGFASLATGYARLRYANSAPDSADVAAFTTQAKRFRISRAAASGIPPRDAGHSVSTLEN